MNNNTQIELYNINYETDGCVVELPTKINTTLGQMECDFEWLKEIGIDNWMNECGADYISNQTGWLVDNFEFKIINN